MMRGHAFNFAALVALASGQLAADSGQSADPGVAFFREGVAACSSDTWNDEVFAAKGFQRGYHYTLKEPGQRVQAYDRVGEGLGLSLHSSLMVYIACSTGADLASPEAYGPTRDALVKEFGLTPAALGEVAFSQSAKAYLKFEKVESASDVYVNNKYAFIFGFRQFDGHNRIFVDVVRHEGVGH
jgi:hypothetical protein